MNEFVKIFPKYDNNFITSVNVRILHKQPSIKTLLFFIYEDFTENTMKNTNLSTSLRNSNFVHFKIYRL